MQLRGVIFVSALTLFGTLSAAEVVLNDGQILTGEIVGRSPERIGLITNPDNSNNIVFLEMSQVREVRNGPATAEPARVSKVEQIPLDASLYLEIPVVGSVGKEIRAGAIADAIDYAVRFRIPHVVFVIDSVDGFDLDETRKLGRVLERPHRGVTFHSLIRNCASSAILIALASDTVHTAPGAKIAGPAVGTLGDDEKVLRRQAAFKAGEMMRAKGRSEYIGRALIDPTATVAAWKDTDGHNRIGPALPADVAKDKVIFENGSDKLLVLDDKAILAFGLRLPSPDIAELGVALKLDKWQAESDYALRRVPEIATDINKAEAVRERDLQKRVDRATGRRAEAENAMKDSIQRAREWDPTNGEYKTYVNTWGWGEYNTQQFTADSRNEWKSRSETTLGFLKDAAQAILALEQYEKECKRLGIKQLYSDQQIQEIKTDISAKFKFVAEQKDRRGN